LVPAEQSTSSREVQRPPLLPAEMNGAELDELFASCMPRLQRTARQMLRNPQDCEDIMQDGLLLAFRKLDQFEGRSSFTTWLHSIIRNSALTHVRRMESRPKCSLEEEINDDSGPDFEPHFIDPGPSPEQECGRRERSRLLREVVQELPSRYGLAMQLCDVEGLEAKEATKILGISSGALKTCLFRARRLATRRMRSRLFPYAGNLQNQENCDSMSNQSSPAATEGSPSAGRMSAYEKNHCTDARALEKYNAAGNQREPRRKRSRFWKRSLRVSVRSTVRRVKRRI